MRAAHAAAALPTAADTALAASAAPIIPPALAGAVSRTQNAFDPFAPWALLAVLLIAVWALARHRRQGLRPARPRVGWRAGAPLIDLPLAMALAALLMLPWAGLAWALHATPPAAWVARIDAQAAQWAQSVMTPALHGLAVRLSDAGDVLPLAVLTLIVAAWLWRCRQRLFAGAWLLSITANGLAVRVLKDFFGRARPEQASAMVTSGYSFPSGHSAGALMVFGLLAWVLCDRFGQRWRPLIVGVALLLIAGIATSRVLLGVHYLSDVLGGVLWASMVLVLTVGVINRARRW